MADAIKCPVTLRGDAWVDIVSATGRVLATGVGRDVADEIARRLNANEAMAAYVLAQDEFFADGVPVSEWHRKYGYPDDPDSRIQAMRAAALAAAKGGQS